MLPPAAFCNMHIEFISDFTITRSENGTVRIEKLIPEFEFGWGWKTG